MCGVIHMHIHTQALEQMHKLLCCNLNNYNTVYQKCWQVSLSRKTLVKCLVSIFQMIHSHSVKLNFKSCTLLSAGHLITWTKKVKICYTNLQTYIIVNQHKKNDKKISIHDWKNLSHQRTKISGLLNLTDVFMSIKML